jgi:membrane protease YdiL (CAAX protease family)
MNTIKDFIVRHPVLAYYILTFAISWCSFLVLIGPGGILGTTGQADVLDPALYLAMLAGPSIAGLLLTGLADGRTGFRELLSRLLKWRVGVRWYVIALLTDPLLVTVTLLALSLTSPVFRPEIVTADDKASLLLAGIVMGLMVGLFEELGWTGFAVPRLRRRYGVLATGLIVGFVWGLWHLPLFLGSVSFSGSVSPTLYLSVLLFSFLPAYRVLMVWVYDRTESLLLAVLMHLPLAASQLILVPLTLSGISLVTYDIAFTAALWVLAAVVAVASHGQLSRQPLQSELA